MLLSEKIQKYLQDLPASFQAEVLDFVETSRSRRIKGRSYRNAGTGRIYRLITPCGR
jgi:hypothetical protein